MRPMFLMVLPALLAAGALILLAVALAEGRGDERAALHRYLASRAAFLLGLAVLSAGVLWQTYRHALDPWLLGALGAMTVGKLLGLLYGRLKN